MAQAIPYGRDRMGNTEIWISGINTDVFIRGFFVTILFEKTKPILGFIVLSSWFIEKMNKGSLKKQSQFVNGRMSISVYII